MEKSGPNPSIVNATPTITATTSDLIVPVVHWNGAPSHSISCMVISPNKRRLVTASKTGNLMLWDIPVPAKPTNNNLQKSMDLSKSVELSSSKEELPEKVPLEPIFLLVQPKSRSPIAALGSVTFASLDAFVSVSEDGTVCVWSYIDGACLASVEKMLTCNPRTLTVLPNRTHIAVGGQSNIIEVVSLKKMKIKLILSGHSNWITHLASVDLRTMNNYTPVIISASMDGVINFWPLKKGEPLHPWETIIIDKGEPIHMSLCPNHKALMITTQHRLILYTAKDPHEVAHVPAPPGGWAGAVFVGQRTVIAWTQDGLGFLYAIPRLEKAESLTFSLSGEAVFSPGLKVPSTMEEVFYESPKQMQANWRMSLLSKLNVIDKSESPSLQPICTFTTDPNYVYDGSALQNLFVGCALGRLFFVGNEKGDVVGWTIPGKPTKRDNNEPTQFLPWAAMNALVPWKNINSTINEKERRSFVTSSLIVEDMLLLVQGYDNGQIAVSNIPSSQNPPVFTQAHLGAVTSLLPTVKDNRKYILSGSRDFCIKLWLVREKNVLELAWKFEHHVGPVTHLIHPPISNLPVSMASAWKNCFFSISEDKTVGLFSIENMNNKHNFGPHESAITKVKWEVDQDYLLVKCTDGSVSIWEMGSGQQEGRVFGQTAYDIFNNTAISIFPENEERDKDAVLHKRSITGVSLNLPEYDAPIQLLYLNVRHLLSDLVKTNDTQSSSPTTNRVALSNSATNLPATPDKRERSSLAQTLPLSFSNFSSPRRESLTTPISVDEVLHHMSHTAKNAFYIMSYLLPWDVDESLDLTMKSAYNLYPPSADISYAMRGQAGNLCLTVPSAAPQLVRWQTYSTLTALHTISAVSYISTLMQYEVFKNTGSQLVAHLCTLMTEKLSHHVEPSLDFLVMFWRDPIEEVMQAARAIFISTANRLSPTERKTFAFSWASKLKEALASGNEGSSTPTKDTPTPSASTPKRITQLTRSLSQNTSLDVSQSLMPQQPDPSKSAYNKGLPLLVLGILGTQFADSLDKELTTQLTKELLKLLNDEHESYSLRVSAAELLGKGFSMWKSYVGDISQLIQQLFSLSLVAKPTNLRATAHQALMLIGSAEPKEFVSTIGHYVLEVNNENMSGKAAAANVSHHSAAIMTLGSLIKQDPVALLPQLPRLVETIVRSLDPHVPYLRDRCLEATTKVLHALVKHYPMISFHQETQRLAVGTKEAAIIIYDLKTATRWHVLEGHKNPVSAVAFAFSGKTLASYSMEDAELRFWSTTTGFLAILGSTPHCIQIIPVSPVTKSLTPAAILDGVKLKWNTGQQNQVALIRSWEGSMTFTFKN